MANKELFVHEIEEILADRSKTFGDDGLSEGARAYFESLKVTKEKPPFTENGAKVLQWMQDNYEAHGNIFTAKGISDNMGLGNSRTVSGALRKLILDGYVSKTEASPTAYSLTEKGKICQITPPESRAD